MAKLPSKKTLAKYFANLQRVEQNREKNAERMIKRYYKQLANELNAYVSGQYVLYAEDDKLDFQTLQRHGQYARFLEEVTDKTTLISNNIALDIKRVIYDTYEANYKGFVKIVEKASSKTDLDGKFKDITLKPEKVKRAVENPVKGLTLNSTLEKHRKEVIHEIRKGTVTGLMNGDSYSTMAKRLNETTKMGYGKAVRIVRTETHRVQESGRNDASNDIHEHLVPHGIVMTKTWRNMGDSRVRGRKPKDKANHVKLEGQVVLQNEEFDLGEGIKASCPTSSGVAKHDVNCRCFIERNIMMVEEYEKLTGRNLRLAIYTN